MATSNRWTAGSVAVPADTATLILPRNGRRVRVRLFAYVGAEIYIAPTAEDVVVATTRTSAATEGDLTIESADAIYAYSGTATKMDYIEESD